MSLHQGEDGIVKATRLHREPWHHPRLQVPHPLLAKLVTLGQLQDLSQPQFFAVVVVFLIFTMEVIISPDLPDL